MPSSGIALINTVETLANARHTPKNFIDFIDIFLFSLFYILDVYSVTAIIVSVRTDFFMPKPPI